MTPNSSDLFSLNHLSRSFKNARGYNPKVYRDFFAAILLSQPPTETRNDWQYPHLYKPLLEYSRKYVPTDLGNYLPANSVIIKKTGLNLNPSEWGIDKDWFYWLKSDSAEYVKPLIRQADDKEKLDLKTWDLADLLRNGQFEKIKDWSKQQNWEDSQLVEPFFKEISEISEPEWKRDNNLIVTRFWDLPFLKLQGEESLFSIREILTKENVLIAQGRVSSLREVEKLGLRVLRVPIQGGYIEQIIQQNIPYLKDQSLLFDKISNHLTAYIQEGKLPLKSEEKQNIFKCLQEISPIESGKLRKIPLFCDTTGTHRSMYQLLPIGFDSKSLLDQYKIHPNESKLDIAWSKFLSQDSEVYHQIIIPNWETILGSVTTENYSEWLGLVKKYYEMSNNKVALTGKKCILFKNKENDISWVLPGEYFFHSKTSALEAEVYALASAAFSTIFGYPLLKPDWVKFLSEPPFAVSNMHLADFEISGQPDLIESRELNAFIFFWTTIGNDFFEHFLTNKAGNGLIQVFGRDDKQFQFYDQEGDIAKLVEEYLPNVGFRLPVELWEWATKSNNILRAGELQKELLDRLKIQLYEVGPKIAALLTTKENVQLLFNRTIEFILPERSEYHEGDEELVWLSQAVNWLGNDEMAKLRKKIAVRPINGEMYNLEKAPANDFIKIDDYRFQKSKLFPNNAESKKASISQRILYSLERTNLNADKLRRLFASNEDNWEETELIEWAEDISQSQDGVVENDDQAAFFALLLNSGRLDTSDIKMFPQSGEQQPLNSQWVLTPYAFVDPIYIPDNKYVDLAKRLKLGANNSRFKFGTEGEIITSFHFINSENLAFFGLTEKPSLGQSLAAIEYLFSLWIKEGSPTEFSKRISIEQWSKTIGFIPESSVYPRQFALNEEESIPGWLDTWVGIDLQRQQFLIALGVQSFQSPVVQLRCFLNNGS